jgi:hypothetical protein
MTTTARALGRLFDIQIGSVPADADGGAITGKRVSLRDAQGVTILVIGAAGTAPDDLQLDLQEHNAASSGTSQDLDIITDYFHKSEATLDGDETWAKVTQAAASEITDVGGAGTSAEVQQLACIDVAAEQLSEGFNWVSLNIPDLGSAGAKYVAIVYILWGLKRQGAPESLSAPQ